MHSCEVFVRGAETGDDIERFKNAYALLKKVMGCLAVAATGRIEWGSFEDDSPTAEDAFGADLAFDFRFTSAVRHDARRLALAPAAADTSPVSPAVPPGTPGTVNALDVSVVPKES